MSNSHLIRCCSTCAIAASSISLLCMPGFTETRYLVRRIWRSTVSSGLVALLQTTLIGRRRTITRRPHRYKTHSALATRLPCWEIATPESPAPRRSSRRPKENCTRCKRNGDVCDLKSSCASCSNAGVPDKCYHLSDHDKTVLRELQLQFGAPCVACGVRDFCDRESPCGCCDHLGLECEYQPGAGKKAEMEDPYVPLPCPREFVVGPRAMGFTDTPASIDPVRNIRQASGPAKHSRGPTKRTRHQAHQRGGNLSPMPATKRGALSGALLDKLATKPSSSMLLT
jgi:hypothetical protein